MEMNSSFAKKDPLPIFRHSGELRDIIYALPVIRALGGGTLLVDPFSTPGGKLPLGEDAAQALLPLLESVSFISEANIYQGEKIDFDLDRFRGIGLSLFSEHLTRSHCRGIGVSQEKVDLSKPWISVGSKLLADIVIGSTRSTKR